MSLNRNNKPKRLKIPMKFFLGVVLTYLIIRAIPYSYSSSNTLLPKKENLLETIETKGILIKKETTYNASDNGMVEIFVEEGNRIKAGTKIATLKSSEDSSMIEGELFQVEESLRELRDSKIELDVSNKKLSDEELEKKVIMDIQSSIKNDKLERIYIYKDQLSNIGVEGQSSEKDLESDAISILEDKRDRLTADMNEKLKQYYSETGGLVSYKIDLYEEEYIPKDFEKYNYDRLKADMSQLDQKIERNTTQFEIEINSPIYKIIDNFEWHLAILVDDLKEIEEIKNDNTVTIKIDEDDKNITGKVVMINEFKNNGVIILRFTDRLHDYYDSRIMDISILKSNKIGYKMPKDAIIDKEGEIGLYIKDLSGVIRFRPVSIIGEDNKNYYLEAGDDSGNLRLNDDKVIKTITNFDEVFLKPENLREGSIIK